MTGPTISTKLAACLQEAGYACPTCGGYGSVPAEPLSDMRLQACPECKGSRLNAEHRAIEAENEAERCDQCGSALDLAPQEPVCRRCEAENAADFSYAPDPRD